MKMKLTAGLVALSFLAMPVMAQDRISFLIGSNHIGATDDFEENNPGIFLTWDQITVGAYTNSYGRTSVAATYALPVFSGDDWSIDVFAGAAYYPVNGDNFAVHIGEWVPVGGLQARYKNIFAQIIPSDGKAADAIFAFGLTYEINR